MRLPELLLGAGFTAVEGYFGFALPVPGSVNHAYMLNIIEEAGRKFVVSSGLMTDNELDELAERVRSGEANMAFPATSAWGQRPT